MELSYTIRFFEENKRQRGDPWSLRQTGVYQSTSRLEPFQSTWILIQPSADLEKRLKIKFELITKNAKLWQYRHLVFHLSILGASFVNWRSYCESLGKSLEQLVGFSPDFSLFPLSLLLDTVTAQRPYQPSVKRHDIFFKVPR